MTNLTPTPEQETILAAAVDTNDNILVFALAGSAKTTTLVMIAEKLRKNMILCIAFSKRIANEMSQRLPGNCESRTLNSLGHGAWSSALNRKLILDKDKNYKILSGLVEALPSSKDKTEAYDNFSETLRAIASGKTCGYIPSGKFRNAKGLMDDSDFFAWLDEEPTALQEQLIIDATMESIKQGFEGRIDFDDQILLPTVFPASFVQYAVVLIDEAQDLSSLNHAMLKKFCKNRVIGVGDECQSIYGFRGAHKDSMDLLCEQYDMKRHTLSICFRCPCAVIREAQWRAPHMQWPTSASEGRVLTLTEWCAEQLPESAVILCRNNAPLFSMAIKLLKNGRSPKLAGNDLGKGLVKIMRKLGPNTMSQKESLEAIDTYLEEKETKSRDHAVLNDRVQCMQIFVSEAETLGAAISYAEHIFAVNGPIQLMTGHKVKGLEFEDIYILDQELIRMDRDQDRNLKYVMQTRSLETLTYISSNGFVDQHEEETI